MRFQLLSLITLLNALTVLSLLIPRDATALIVRDDSRLNGLFKRKGGGGGGKGGSSGSSSSSSGSSSSSSGGSTSGGSASSGGARSGAGSTSASPSYGGGRYYGGGATVPYAAGSSSSRGLGSRGLLPIAALGFFGGAWLAGAYLYSYPRPYSFYNTSANQNQTRPVICLCQEYNPCGCDDSDDNGYLNSIIGNGSYASLNPSLVRVADVNGTTTIALNGTLPNSTSSTSAAPAGPAGPAGFGWMALATAFAAAVWTL